MSGLYAGNGVLGGSACSGCFQVAETGEVSVNAAFTPKQIAASGEAAAQLVGEGLEAADGVAQSEGVSPLAADRHNWRPASLRQCSLPGLELHELSNSCRDVLVLRTDYLSQSWPGTKSWINPIFVVPGSISKPDFQGLKLGHFSRKKKGLVVMIAVPGSVALGKAVPEFVVASLKDAAHVAAAHFKSKGISFPLDEAEQLIAGIEARLTATSIAVH